MKSISVRSYDKIGDLRSAIARGNLSRLNLGADPEGIYKHYLSSLPLDLLVTGAEWVGLDTWESTLKREAVLSICGVVWWEGNAWKQASRWSVEVRRGVLDLFESGRMHDTRPRKAIEAHEHYLDQPNISNLHARKTARDAANQAGQSARLEYDFAGYHAALSAASFSLSAAVHEAAAALAYKAIEVGGPSPPWDAAKLAERAKQEESWLRFMIEEGMP